MKANEQQLTHFIAMGFMQALGMIVSSAALPFTGFRKLLLQKVELQWRT